MTLEIEGNKLESLYSLYYLKNRSHDFYGHFLYSGDLGWGNTQFWKNHYANVFCSIGTQAFRASSSPLGYLLRSELDRRDDAARPGLGSYKATI